MPKVLNQSGFAHLALLLFLVIALIIGLVVIKDPTNLIPKAYDSNLDLSNSDEKSEVTISGKAFVDMDSNGSQGSVDRALEGLKVYGPWIKGESSRRSSVTDNQGNWSMSIPDYFLFECDRCNSLSVASLPGLKPTYATIDIPLSKQRVAKIEGYDFPYTGTYEITGKLFHDENRNNFMDSNESVLEGLEVMASVVFKIPTGTLSYYFRGVSGIDGMYTILLPPLEKDQVKISFPGKSACDEDSCWDQINFEEFSPGNIDRDYIIDFALFNYPNPPTPPSSSDPESSNPSPVGTPESCTPPFC